MMTDKIDEQMSSLMDDELAPSEQPLLLRRLCGDDALKQRWERFHLIRDALHHELPIGVDRGLADRISLALESEPGLHSRSTPLLSRILRPVAGLAIAASVATLAILGVRELDGARGVGAGQEVATVARNAATPSSYVRVGGIRWNMQKPEIEARLNGFLVNHNEYSSETNLQGMLHYVRIAGYDPKPEQQ